MFPETRDSDQINAAIERYSRFDQIQLEINRQFSDAFAYSNMGSSLTYRQLGEYARNLASFLQNCTQLKPGDRVAIQLPNVLQYPVAVQAIWRAGLVVVNTNPLYTVDEVIKQYCEAEVKAVIILANDAKMLEEVIPHTQVKLVLVSQLADLHPIPRRIYINFAARLIRRIVPKYRLKNAISLREALTLGERYNLQPYTGDASETAMIQYTVGTTGKPKGVQITHRNLIANLFQVRSRLDDSLQNGQELAIAPLPLFHIYSFAMHCLILPSWGTHTVLITNPKDISGFVAEMAKWPFTLFSGLNSLFVGLSQNSHFRQLDFSSLKVTLSGGMALMRSVCDEWKEITGCRIMQGYGLTEASPVVAVPSPKAFSFESVGQPLPLTEVKIVGDDGCQLCSGETGEVYIKGPQLMNGYWVHGQGDEIVDGWFPTGDIGCLLDDGRLKIIERKTEIIHVAGFPVYPNELENIISGHPDIIECAVVGLPDETQGRIIKLFVVTSNHRLTVKEVRDYCRERLTNYKVPRLVEFRAGLPKSIVGKVVRRELLSEELIKMQKLRKHV